MTRSGTREKPKYIDLFDSSLCVIHSGQQGEPPYQDTPQPDFLGVSRVGQQEPPDESVVKREITLSTASELQLGHFTGSWLSL